jgi:hypothetical protein
MSNEAAIFTVSDLQVIDDEPRIRDLDLGVALGMSQPRNIRQVIEENRAELESYGNLLEVRANSGKRGRPGREFLLNEPQAILVTMRSNAPHAGPARRSLVEVFMAFRRGLLQPAMPAQLPLADSTLDEKFRTLCRWIKDLFAKQDAKHEERFKALESAVWKNGGKVLKSVRGAGTAPAELPREIDICGVYRAVGLDGPIPQRGHLSQRLGNSLDAFCRDRRIALGCEYLLGHRVRRWPEAVVLEWHTEIGHEIIDRHMDKHKASVAAQPMLRLVEG